MRRVREVELHRRRIEAVFARAANITGLPDAEEMQADYARFLCVLLSGWVEKTVAALIMAHTDGKASRPLRSFVEASLGRLTNVTAERLVNTMGALDKSWRDQLQASLSDEETKALNSIVGLRNNIAHGGDGTMTLTGLREYWAAVQAALDQFEELLLGDGRSLARTTHRARH